MPKPEQWRKMMGDNPAKTLLADIEAFMARYCMTATKFSWGATGKKSVLVSNLRDGRGVTLATADAAYRFMAEHERRYSVPSERRRS